MKKITILVPCYNEEKSLPLLHVRLATLMDSMTAYEWELLLVNDGSSDKTMDVVRELRAMDSRVGYIDLSRNFGKERAMLAGMDHATGDCMVIMDADLQDPPEVIPEMIKHWEDGWEDVYARRISRGKESWLRRKLSLCYYSVLQKTTKVDVLQNVGDFRLIDRKCIDALKQMRECERYTKGLFSWMGFKKKEITFDRHDRAAGESSFDFFKLMLLGIDGITSFTTAPLRFATVLGFAVSVFAFIYMCYVLVKTLIWGDPVAGYPTLIIVILFLGGVQLISLGIIGEYLGRIFNETKDRPVYIVREKEM
ncbi:glycosyltransferase family 2 protein [Sodaliphilus sp.]|uniref:glycosyltransferase family 2 protein n=1 Tax=Sodaliphilus sp. TaxID=2815818 RepID=UPI00388E6F5E